MEQTYIAIDLKSFYASAECVFRNLDPLNTCLVVADQSRSNSTICLAVSPPLKQFGLPGRCRLFEAKQKIAAVNEERRKKIPDRCFKGKSVFLSELEKHPDYEIDFIIAPPNMGKYITMSSEIFSIYQEMIAEEDIHVYSIDEVFINATPYLKIYGISPHELALLLIKRIIERTGITATAGIGTNLYLAKVAMDIVAKHIEPDKDGVRIAELNETAYKRLLWNHEPITDFWRVGAGTAARLRKLGITTMGDIARTSLNPLDYPVNEESLYKTLGINAEILIDHAWGYEDCTLSSIKKYRSKSQSVNNGQVLPRPYSFEETKIVVREMADELRLMLVEKCLTAESLALYICYDTENTAGGKSTPFIHDYLGRTMPKPVHGGVLLKNRNSVTESFGDIAQWIFETIACKDYSVRRLSVTAGIKSLNPMEFEERGLFDADNGEIVKQAFKREQKLQKSVLGMKQKYGKNAVLKAMNLQEGATQMMRNSQIGGHKA
ncbi:MAG: DNA methylase [Treponemataceae bacterium]|nr:DNA methylase [Treponemataceae bacterium]